MRLRVLGATGAEFPGFHPPAFLIDGCLLMDAGTIGAVLGEDEQWGITDILLTHSHLDHIRAIPFLADNIVVKNRTHHVSVHALPATLAALKRHIFNGLIWPDFTRIPSIERPTLRLKPIRTGRPFKLEGYTVTAYPVTHPVEAVGYVIESPGGARLLYTGDTGPSEEIWAETRKGVDCAIIEVSMPNRMRKMAIMTGHLTPSLLKDELRKMYRPPERILVTHPKLQHLERISRELDALGMRNIRVLRDGDEYEV